MRRMLVAFDENTLLLYIRSQATLPCESFSHRHELYRITSSAGMRTVLESHCIAGAATVRRSCISAGGSIGSTGSPPICLGGNPYRSEGVKSPTPTSSCDTHGISRLLGFMLWMACPSLALLRHHSSCSQQTLNKRDS